MERRGRKVRGDEFKYFTEAGTEQQVGAEVGGQAAFQ